MTSSHTQAAALLEGLVEPMDDALFKAFFPGIKYAALAKSALECPALVTAVAALMEENRKLRGEAIQEDGTRVDWYVTWKAEHILREIAESERAALLRLLRDMHKELSEGPTMDDDTWRRLTEVVRS